MILSTRTHTHTSHLWKITVNSYTHYDFKPLDKIMELKLFVYVRVFMYETKIASRFILSVSSLSLSSSSWLLLLLSQKTKLLSRWFLSSFHFTTSAYQILTSMRLYQMVDAMCTGFLNGTEKEKFIYMYGKSFKMMRNQGEIISVQ